MFSPSGVDFTQGKAVLHETYAHPDQATLVLLQPTLDATYKTIKDHGCASAT